MCTPVARLPAGRRCVRGLAVRGEGEAEGACVSSSCHVTDRYLRRLGPIWGLYMHASIPWEYVLCAEREQSGRGVVVSDVRVKFASYMLQLAWSFELRPGRELNVGGNTKQLEAGKHLG